MVLCGSRVPAWHGEEGFWSPHGALGGGSLGPSWCHGGGFTPLMVPWGSVWVPDGAMWGVLGPSQCGVGALGLFMML